MGQKSSKQEQNGNKGNKESIVKQALDVNNSTNQMIFSRYKTKMTVDDFEMLKLIGKGNFANVMLVKQKDTGKIYAMKILDKDKLVKTNQLLHTLTERVILQHVDHPFLIKLEYAFQNKSKLYLVMEFVDGGELFFHLKQEIRFSESRAKMYAAELLLAIESLHSKRIVYRDLKPENVLLKADGHICLTDFGLSKILEGEMQRTNTFCGTPEYLAPEVIVQKKSGYGKPVDWWSFGTLLYEMLVGIPPFYSENIQLMYDQILKSELKFPSVLSDSAKDLLARLLEREPSQRLGTKGSHEIRNHPFFKGLDWDKVYNKEYKPKFIPQIDFEGDVKYFEREFTNQKPEETTPDDEENLNGDIQKHFEGFSYVGNSKINEYMKDKEVNSSSPIQTP